MNRRLLFIINPAAGKKCLKRWQSFETRLRRLGFEFEHAISTRPAEVRALARDKAASYDTLVAVGGDGTVFDVVNGMMLGHQPAPVFGILPFGTGNDSAGAIGIRTEEDTIRALTSGTRRAIDLIEIQCQQNGIPATQFAMLFASVGITGELLRRTTPRVKALFGQRLAYGVGLFLALTRHVSSPMKVTCGGRTFEKRLILACASNGQTFGGGIRVAPRARLDDGKLDVNLIDDIGIFEILRQLRSLYEGRHISHPKVCYDAAEQLAIETDPAIDVAADGDLIGQTPARFQIRSKVLTVLAPPVAA